MARLVVFGLVWIVLNFFRAKKKPNRWIGLRFRRLAMSYFHMANCHTIIGAKRFHFRVRDGIGWFTLAMVTKQLGLAGLWPTVRPLRMFLAFSLWLSAFMRLALALKGVWKSVFVSLALDQRPVGTPKRIGCYMVKPHGQLVYVSYMHYCTSTSYLSTSSSSTALQRT